MIVCNCSAMLKTTPYGIHIFFDDAWTQPRTFASVCALSTHMSPPYDNTSYDNGNTKRRYFMVSFKESKPNTAEDALLEVLRDVEERLEWYFKINHSIKKWVELYFYLRNLSLMALFITFVVEFLFIYFEKYSLSISWWNSLFM